MREELDGGVMAESIGVFAAGLLGGDDRLTALHVVAYPRELRAVVWASLIDTSLDSQLRTVADFASVTACYTDEFEVELRFGVPLEPAPENAVAKVAALSR
jgi:hypothetical protein